MFSYAKINIIRLRLKKSVLKFKIYFSLSLLCFFISPKANKHLFNYEKKNFSLKQHIQKLYNILKPHQNIRYFKQNFLKLQFTIHETGFVFDSIIAKQKHPAKLINPSINIRILHKHFFNPIRTSNENPLFNQHSNITSKPNSLSHLIIQI